MDDKTLQKHYERIMRDLENEKLMTFEELVNITKIRPEVLKRTIPVLARGLCCYQKQAAESMEDQDLDDEWTVQDMRDIVAFEEKRERAMQRYYKEKAQKRLKNIGNKENTDLDGKDDLEDFISDFHDGLNIDNPNFEKKEKIVSFEDLVKLTGTHPFYLERCLCHLAILAETEN